MKGKIKIVLDEATFEGTIDSGFAAEIIARIMNDPNGIAKPPSRILVSNLVRNKKIEAIKFDRDIYNSELHSAKDKIDSTENGRNTLSYPYSEQNLTVLKTLYEEVKESY